MEKQNLENLISELKHEVSSLKKNEKNKELRLKRFLKAGLITFLFTSSFYGFALILNLHIFAPGEIISAQKINENFEYLNNKIDGVAGGAFISENIPSFQIINLAATDNGKLFVVQNTAEMNLPSVASVTPGYTVKLSLIGPAQVRINLQSGDEYDYSTDVLIMTANNNNAAYYEIMSTGTNWINKLTSGGSTDRFAASRYYTGACTGRGFGTDNCFTNTTATDPAKGIVKIAGFYYRYNGTNIWERLGIWDYLINDPNALLSETRTTNWQLGQSQVQETGGIIHILSYDYTRPRWMANYDASMDTNAGGQAEGHMNNFIFTSLSYLSNGITYYNGTNCQQWLGGNWRHIDLTEALTIGNPFGEPYYTGTTGVAANTFTYIESDGTPTDIGNNVTSYRAVCKYQP